MRVGSLFSGIGGIELGLSRAMDADVLFQCEIDPFCREVLEKHWPDAKRFSDVRELDPAQLPVVDVLCGGFPCQDLSDAARGRNDGLDGERSGLWFEMLRIVKGLRPKWLVIENVAGAAIGRWLPYVRRDLHHAGYASVPLFVPADHVGAPHRRARVWVVGHPYEEGKPARAFYAEVARVRGAAGLARPWPAPPELLRMDDGLPDRFHRNQALGNAVVVQCAEVIGGLIDAARAA